MCQHLLCWKLNSRISPILECQRSLSHQKISNLYESFDQETPDTSNGSLVVPPKSFLSQNLVIPNDNIKSSNKSEISNDVEVGAEAEAKVEVEVEEEEDERVGVGVEGDDGIVHFHDTPTSLKQPVELENFGVEDDDSDVFEGCRSQSFLLDESNIWNENENYNNKNNNDNDNDSFISTHQFDNDEENNENDAYVDVDVHAEAHAYVDPEVVMENNNQDKNTYYDESYTGYEDAGGYDIWMNNSESYRDDYSYDQDQDQDQQFHEGQAMGGDEGEEIYDEGFFPTPSLQVFEIEEEVITSERELSAMKPPRPHKHGKVVVESHEEDDYFHNGVEENGVDDNHWCWSAGISSPLSSSPSPLQHNHRLVQSPNSYSTSHLPLINQNSPSSRPQTADSNRPLHLTDTVEDDDEPYEISFSSSPSIRLPNKSSYPSSSSLSSSPLHLPLQNGTHPLKRPQSLPSGLRVS